MTRHRNVPAARRLCASPVFTGVTSRRLGDLIVELADPWDNRCESDRHNRRGHTRLRARGAGGGHHLVFTDRVLVTLIKLRHGLPNTVLAVLFECSRQTVDRAVKEILPLLANRGFTVTTGVRLYTLADVFAYAQTEGVTLRLDGTEVRVRRPPVHKAGRNRFVSGKARANTIKTTIVTDKHARPLWAGAVVPGRVHDQTAIKHEGIVDLLDQYPQVRILADNGYRGLSNSRPTQVIVPPAKPAKDADEETINEWKRERKQQSTNRIPVEHGIGHLKNWRVLQRWTGPRDTLPDMILAVTGLVSDRTVTA